MTSFTYSTKARNWFKRREWVCPGCDRIYRLDELSLTGVVTRRTKTVAGAHCPYCARYQILEGPPVREMGLTVLHRSRIL